MIKNIKQTNKQKNAFINASIPKAFSYTASQK